MATHYRIGRFEVRPEERRVLDVGSPVVLGARAFDLLLHLLEHRDRLVPKAELLERVWAGRVVEDGNLTVQISALRKVFGPDVVATVAGQGYRLAVPVDEAPAADAGPPLPDRPSLAVLPFASSGGDEDSLFTDGLVEDLITELSRFQQIFVIARSSSFSYRGRQLEARTVGRELGVQYLLEGSLQRSEGRLRVRASLVDARSGNQVWAERYDRALESLFSVQEDLTRSIVTELWPQLEDSELGRARLTGSGSVNAYLLALRARRLIRQAFLHGGQVAMEQDASELLSQAMAIDAHSGEVQRALGQLRWLQLWLGSAASREEALAEGLHAVQRALEINPGDYLAYHRRALLKSLAGRDDCGLDDIRQAHALNPNDSGTLSVVAVYEAGHGQFDRGLQLAADTLRLSPRDPLRLHFFNMHQILHHYAARYDDALAWCERALAEAHDHAPSHYFRMVALAALGRDASAHDAARGLRAVAPAFAASRFAGHGPRYCDAATFDRERRWVDVATR